jgi:hypothetical protein
MSTQPKRRRPAAAITLAVAALMLTAPTATAKLIGGMTICGSDGCRPVARSAAQHFHDIGGLEGTLLPRPPRSAPFYKLNLSMVDDLNHRIGGFRTAWVPSAHALHAIDGPDPWFAVTPAVMRELRRLTAGRSPYPARRLASTISTDTTESNGALLPETYTPAPPAPPANPSTGGGTDLLPWISAATAIIIAVGLVMTRAPRRRRSPGRSRGSGRRRGPAGSPRRR